MLEVRRTDEFADWLRRLRDVHTRARINLRIDRIIATGNFGDSKYVGEGINELRIDYGPGYRLYYTEHEGQLLILLIGGDKSTQQRDIRQAHKLAREYGEGNEHGDQ